MLDLKSGVHLEEEEISRVVIDEELEIKKGSTAPREAGEYGLPFDPVLIVMCELDVDVLEWNCADVSNYFQGLWSAE